MIPNAKHVGQWLAILLVLTMAACASPPVEQVPIDPALAPFFKAFAREYHALADTEEAQRDWREVNLFDEKAALAEQGQLSEPDQFDQRKLADDQRAALVEARGRIVTAFNRGGRELAGPLAARTQAFFDCWVQEAEENFQNDDIAACRTGFESSIPQLEKASNRAVVALLPGDDSSAVVAEFGGQETLLSEPYQAVAGSLEGASTVQLSEGSVGRLFSDELAGEPKAATTFILNFQTGGVELTPEGEQQLELALEEISIRENADVSVVGHTDSVGPNRINVPLARNRAAFVEDILRERGAEPRFLEVDSFGESDPLVPVGDEVPEERNRRVEIVVR